MKRRDVIKGLPFLPLAGGFMANMVPNAVLANTAQPLTGLPNGIGAAAASPLAGEQNIFRSIGVEPLINCRGTFTIIGGSLERPSVRAAMEAASRNFVQYDELADGIGKRLAELTQSPYGMVSAGCAAGLKHVTAACVTGGNPEKLIRIPDLSGFEKTEVVIPISSRNVYDHAIRNIGVKIINVDTLEELSNVLSSRTAMIYLTSEDSAPFTVEAVAKLAKAKNVPLLVDAAAEDLTIPCIHLQNGATIVAYSGGKAMCGPQCAGLLIGDKDILMSAWQASSPHHGPGRDNKVGREEMIGMMAAVEAWITLDHKAEWKKWLGWLDNITKQVSKIEGIKTEVRATEELSNHSPELIISWDPAKLNITGDEVAEELGRTKPRIALAGNGRSKDPNITSIGITTGQMQAGEDKIVSDRIIAILSQKRSPASTAMKAPAANISGRWDLDIAFFSSASKHTLYLQQEDNWITGSHKGEFTVRDLTGSIEGDQVKFRSTDHRPGDNITFTFSGTVTGDAISGSIFMGEYRTAKFTGKRNNSKSPKMPIKVPSGPPLAT
ncbi:MAG: aminotransferase class V-fold PLP-dependent enzyme [Flavitalea sp.]